MTPDIDLDAIRARLMNAIDGPWAIWPDLRPDGLITIGDATGVIPEGETWTDGPSNTIAHVYTEEDADFILHAPADMAALLSALTATRAELDAFMHARIQGDDMAARVTWLSDELVRVEAERDFWKSKRHPDAARQDVEYWKGKYEAGAMDQLAAVAQPDVNRQLDVLCECRDDGQCEHNGVAAGAQPDDERWTWAVSCPGCGQAKGHPCTGALGGDGAVHPERRGRAVAFGYGLNAAAGAGDGEQDTATCSCKWSPVQGRIWCDPCATARNVVLAAASVQSAADGEAQA